MVLGKTVRDPLRDPFTGTSRGPQLTAEKGGELNITATAGFTDKTLISCTVHMPTDMYLYVAITSNGEQALTLDETEKFVR